MSAKVVRGGLAVAGFDESGNPSVIPVEMTQAEVPGEFGSVMFVIIGNEFCWVEGLPTGKGYKTVRLPLTGDQSTWQSQIKKYASDDPPDFSNSEIILAGARTELAQANLYIVAE